MRIDRRPSPNQLVLWPRHELTPVIGTPRRQAPTQRQPQPAPHRPTPAQDKPSHGRQTIINTLNTARQRITARPSPGRQTSGPSQTQPDLTRPKQQVNLGVRRSGRSARPSALTCMTCHEPVVKSMVNRGLTAIVFT